MLFQGCFGYVFARCHSLRWDWVAKSSICLLLWRRTACDWVGALQIDSLVLSCRFSGVLAMFSRGVTLCVGIGLPRAPFVCCFGGARLVIGLGLFRLILLFRHAVSVVFWLSFRAVSLFALGLGCQKLHVFVALAAHGL